MRLREKQLIEQIRRAARPGPSVMTGIGDDCAVLKVPAGHELLVTTDFTIENVHFRRDWLGPEQIGRRCLTRGLSDIAAMGGEPRAAFLSLAVADSISQKWAGRFLKGLLELAKEFNVPLAGGDTAESPAGIQADIIVVGSVPSGKAVLRSGAAPGDNIYVTGELGGTAAALAALMTSGNSAAKRKAYSRTFHPPRIAVGKWLRQRGIVSAMIDLSDGFSTDLAHICEESNVGAEIDADVIPRARAGSAKKQVALDFALHGGEDYELLFTSAKTVPTMIEGVHVTRIGRIVPLKKGQSSQGQPTGMRLIASDRRSQALRAQGWEHFRRNS